MNKILVVEDDEQTRKNLCTILRMEGYDVFSTGDGISGLDAARTRKPNLVICDVMMPQLDGLGLLAALRADQGTAHIPLMFLSARGERNDLRAGMNLGADDYLTKPVSAEELLAAVHARFKRESQRPPGGFKVDFTSAVPLEALGLTKREAEILLWVAQGKSNSDIAIIVGSAEATVKKHLQNLFGKLGVESRNATALRALEVLGDLGSNRPAYHPLPVNEPAKGTAPVRAETRSGL
ncbi:MAG: response regulator transcription factor [Verrucomicrobia bacterium]|nr:response regulator transcription factor [Verrucomicrobiota bacterium]